MVRRNQGDIVSILHAQRILSYNSTTGRKIRDAEVSKIPFIIVVGEREEAEEKITVRKHGGKNIGNITTNEFIEIVKKEMRELIRFTN